MNRSVLLALVLAVGAVLWVASGEFARSSREAPDAPAAVETEAPPLATVRVLTSTAKPYTEAIVIAGRTEASRAVTVRAETQGRVAEVLVERGALVEAGQPVVRLAEDDRRARLAEAEALIDQRTIELNAATSLASKGYQTEIRAAEMMALTERARALLAAIETDLDHTVIRAPFDGAVDERAAELGSYLDVGDAVATIVDLDPALVVAELTERDVGKVTVGRKGEARLVTGQTLEGAVRFIARVADPATHTFRVELEVANPDGRVVAGITAEVRLPLESVPAHLVSPAVLTLGDDGVVGVKTVEPDGRVGFRPVELIADGVDGVWITGLPETATVIVVGQEYVLAGQRVSAVAAE
ncbi:MAG: efflux RND transporter periplasmic adaptor subunit [Alphaproteobacteria bacterium]